MLYVVGDVTAIVQKEQKLIPNEQRQLISNTIKKLLSENEGLENMRT